jgi:hypothetical protein
MMASTPRWNPIWPDISTLNNAKMTVHLGVGVTVWLAGSYALNVILITFTGESLFSARHGGYVDNYDRYSTLFVDMVGAIAGAWLANRLWFRYSVAAAWAALAWVVIELIAGFALDSPSGVLVPLIWFAVQGVRGALTVQRLSPAVPVEMEPRQNPQRPFRSYPGLLLEKAKILIIRLGFPL